MATITRHDESLVERDEVLYPSTNVIDTEPHYNNFTTIQNALQQRNGRTQTNLTTHYRSHSSDDQYRAIHTQIEPISSSRHYYSNEMLNAEHSSKTFPVPVNIQSKQIDGHIFNLTRIVEDIGYNRNTPLIRSSSNNPNTKNVSALLNIVLKMGGAHGPLVNVWRSRIDNDYFQRWYLEKHDQRSASMIERNSVNHSNVKTTQKPRDYQSNIAIDNIVSTKLPIKPIDQGKNYQNVIKQIYGYDDVDTASSVSSHSSTSELELLTKQKSPSLTSILKKNNNNNNNSPAKHRVTIRENHSPNEFNRSLSSRETNNNNNKQHIISDYEQFIRNHPDLNNDPNPEIITRSNPDHITYQQNVSVRYLVPPTPPPPGPLIIREIISPRAPSPPPLVVKYQEPSPPTPPPLILREAPPPPPRQQETTVITKVVPQESQSSRRVIVEHSAPLPPKPQPIIIEKWLPYKPAPPREVIYERVTEQPVVAEFEPGAINIDRQRRHSAEFHSKSTRTQIPVNNQRRNSVDLLEENYIVEQPAKTFDQLAWSTHQQILAMQQRGRQQVQAHQQWAAAQWQQHANMFLQYPHQLTTPSLVVYHPPTTMNTAGYVQRQEVRQEQVHYNQGYIYPFY